MPAAMASARVNGAEGIAGAAEEVFCIPALLLESPLRRRSYPQVVPEAAFGEEYSTAALGM
ncbi:hypothetical protein GCM10010523_02630 [Paenarthrobacter ilicis]